MSTKTRPELSIKNKYYIDRHRYYELKHFCLQYDVWKEACRNITSLSQSNYSTSSRSNSTVSPVEKCYEAREYFLKRMDMVERAVKETDSFFSDYILLAVTKGLSYDKLLLKTNIPCCKDIYYDLYRRFFWILNKIRN